VVEVEVAAVPVIVAEPLPSPVDEPPLSVSLEEDDEPSLLAGPVVLLEELVVVSPSGSRQATNTSEKARSRRGILQP
jgi:hypothetical protein